MLYDTHYVLRTVLGYLVYKLYTRRGEMLVLRYVILKDVYLTTEIGNNSLTRHNPVKRVLEKLLALHSND